MSDATGNYVFLSDCQLISENWRKYSGYTVRPTASTCREYERVVKQECLPGHRALAYGGTPEIRDVLASADVDVTLVDRSETMVRAMGLLTNSRAMLGARERFVQCDWRSISVRPDSIHLEMADDAINMLDWRDFGAFLGGARDALVRGGLFVCRLLLQPPVRYRRQTVREVLRDFDAGEISSVYELASRINFANYDEATFRMGWQRSIESLSMLRGGDQDVEGHIAWFKDLFQYCNSSFACPPRDDWEGLARRYFTIEGVFHPSEYEYSRSEPIYLLRKN